MTACRRFDEAWQERFDTRANRFDFPGDQPAWSGHLAACPTCRALDRRYRVLARALAACSPSPAMPDLTDRILAEWHRPRVPRRALLAVGGLAAAAALLLALALPRGVAPPPDPHPAPTQHVRARPVAEAVVDASTASIELARAASEPAGRLGQELFARLQPEAPPAPPTITPVEPAAVVQAVGRRLDLNVRPIARSAARAFDFLVPSLARVTLPRGA
jgi:hypothetical protein